MNHLLPRRVRLRARWLALLSMREAWRRERHRYEVVEGILHYLRQP